MPLLSVNQVVAYRRADPLFGPATFDVEKGQFAFITGSNGVGKTTLLDCIAGIYRNWDGLIQGTELVSYCLQGVHFPRTLSLSRVAHLIAGFDQIRYEDLLEKLALKAEQHKLLSLMSGGELQRAKLLIAMLQRHSVLLLDEPFANLDSASYEAIVSELDRTSDQRSTVIVSHPRDLRQELLRGGFHCELSLA
jgi:ABC-type multidrug transport system ATPase subunit